MEKQKKKAEEKPISLEAIEKRMQALEDKVAKETNSTRGEEQVIREWCYHIEDKGRATNDRVERQRERMEHMILWNTASSVAVMLAACILLSVVVNAWR